MGAIRKQIRERSTNEQVFHEARRLGFSALQARVIAGRAVGGGDAAVGLENMLFPALKNIHHPELLQDGGRAAGLIVEAVRDGKRIGILTDYDVDGICSHVVVHEALRLFNVEAGRLLSLIGHRMHDGYGVSASLVDRVVNLTEKPHLIITADCGSSDEQQIGRLRKAGISVVVTDHHALPAEGVPASAAATVNPSRRDCPYPDKSISGCMVSWLLMCLVRHQLIDLGLLPAETVRLGGLLDFVCLSTVADAVTFTSPTNRAVVNSGLQIINQGIKPAWRILADQLGKNDKNPFTAEDLAFQIAPRINARSRMADPLAALYFFMAENSQEAEVQLLKLEKNNEQRKVTERDMVRTARRQAKILLEAERRSLVVCDASFHAGVQGIVAARLVEGFGRPAVVLSPVQEGAVLSGSARTIPEVHLFEVLQKMNARHPDLFLSFGGHRGAAGLKMKKENFDLFRDLFEEMVRAGVEGRDLAPFVLTDGDLAAEMLHLDTLSALQRLGPFGRDFEEPAFAGIFTVRQARIVGAEPVHLALKLEKKGREFQGIWFRAVDNPGDIPDIKQGNTIRCVYKLKSNHFRGQTKLQLLVDYAENA
jgi:single-stranded-DNA-specific exonuclease